LANLENNFDAYVIGSGPNGLAAAINLAQKGLKVKVFEAKDTIGGGTRTQELTEPGFLHDVCSAVHPTAVSSPFFNTLPLADYGLEWIYPEFQIAHPLANNEAVIIEQSFENTLQRLGKDGKNYSSLFKSLIDSWPLLVEDVFGTLRVPKHPLQLIRFGWFGMFSAKHLSNSLFKSDDLKTYFAGLAAHSIIPLEKAFTATFGLMLGITAHTVGWPIAKGGSKSITDALAAYFISLGGVIETNRHIQSLDEFPENKPILFDLTPRQIVQIAGNRIPDSIRNRLKKYTYGPGVFKMDFALSEPTPWANKEARRAGTLHLGSTYAEIAKSERDMWNGIHSEKPYVLISQPSIFDETRAPKGKHTLWAYCHVPAGSTKDMTVEIENQIERYAPGFKDTIISKALMNTVEFEKYNPNYIGGDINGGAQFATQLFGRPLFKWNPYKLGDKGIYICSSSTPPGGGVHGMAGFHASQTVLKNEFNLP